MAFDVRIRNTFFMIQGYQDIIWEFLLFGKRVGYALCLFFVP
jgi:hypothetical protein